MSETPRSHISKNTEFLEGICTKIKELYPQINEIQYSLDSSKHISFWIIVDNVLLDENDLRAIRQNILREISQKNNLKCSIHDIDQVSTWDMILKNQVWLRYIESVCARLETTFWRDGIRVQYDERGFIVYGAAPRDKVNIGTEIARYIQHLELYDIKFLLLRELEEKEAKVVATIHRTNDAFQNVGVS